MQAARDAMVLPVCQEGFSPLSCVPDFDGQRRECLRMQLDNTLGPQVAKECSQRVIDHELRYRQQSAGIEQRMLENVERVYLKKQLRHVAVVSAGWALLVIVTLGLGMSVKWVMAGFRSARE